MQPTLLTTRLVLRPAGPADADALWTLWTDPDVRRYLWDDRTITRAKAAAALADCAPLGAQGLGLWVVQPAAGVIAGSPSAEVVLGCAGLLPVSTAAECDTRLTGMVEPLVALAPGAWGRGYAYEALGALLHHAGVTLGLSRLAAVTDVPNSASDRLLRRAGFVVLGEVAGPRYPLRTYLWEAAPARGAAPAG